MTMNDLLVFLLCSLGLTITLIVLWVELMKADRFFDFLLYAATFVIASALIQPLVT